jgi:hypothetical protein
MFRCLTPVTSLSRRTTGQIASAISLDPTNSACLAEGEWLKVSSGERARVGSTPVADVAPAWSETGSIHAQVGRNVTFIEDVNVEFETDMYDATSIVEGSPLCAKNITVSGVTRSGLAIAGNNEYVVAIARGITSGVLRGVKVSPFRNSQS